MPHWKNRVATAAAVVCGLCAVQAQAETYTFTLEGDAGLLQTDSFLASNRLFMIGSVPLSGLQDVIEVVSGDEITASVSLPNGPLVVPASPNQVYGFELRGPESPQFDDSPEADVVFAGSANFYWMGELVRSVSNGCDNCSFIAVFAAPGEAVSFDQIEVTGQFLNLTSPYSITEARIYYQLSQPVPEPATWALWLAGLGLAGVAARRRAAA